MRIGAYQFPDDLYYDLKHDWARVEGNTVTQGITDLGQALAREIVFVGLPRAGRQAQQGQTLISLESGKWVGRAPATISGKITEVNAALEDEARDINDSPYDLGWLVKVELTDLAELQKLLRADSAEYQAFILTEIEKFKKVLTNGRLR